MSGYHTKSYSKNIRGNFGTFRGNFGHPSKHHLQLSLDVLDPLGWGMGMYLNAMTGGGYVTKSSLTPSRLRSGSKPSGSHFYDIFTLITSLII